MGTLSGPFTVTPGSNLTETVAGFPDTGAIIVYNESPYFVNVQCTGGAGILPLAAYTADIIPVANGFNGSLNISAQGYLSTSVNGPASVIFIRTIAATEPLYVTLMNGGATGFPMPLTRLQSIGNDVNVSSNTLTAERVNNTDNAVPNAFITAGYSSTPTIVQAFNNGQCTWDTWDGATQRHALRIVPGAGTVKIGDTLGVDAEVVGNLYVDSNSFLQALNVAGACTLNSGLTVFGGVSISTTLSAGATSVTTLSTSGLATLNSMSVANNASVTGTLSVTGATSLSTLTTSGLASPASLTCTGAVNFASATLSGTLNAANVVATGNVGTATLSSGGLATLSSLSVTTTASVTGNTSLSTLSTTGLATLNSASVTNNASVGGTLGVTGATTLNSTLEVKGQTQVDAAIVSKAATDLVLNAPIGQNVVSQVNGTAIETVSATAVTLAKKLVFPDGTSLSGVGFFNGIGPGTFNHGAPTTPYRVFFVVNAGTATPISYDGLTSTQVNVHVAASTAWFGMYITI